MNDNLKIKLLQHYLNKNSHQGVTLAEAIIIFLILGGLLILGIPFLFSSKNRIVRSEVKSYIGTMNRAQQAYFLENNGKFAQNIQEMRIGIKEQTENYKYYTKVTEKVAFNYAIARHPYIQINWLDRKPIYSYISAVFSVPTGNKSELITDSISCENNQPGSIIPAEPIYKNGVIQCASGTKEIFRVN